MVTIRHGDIHFKIPGHSSNSSPLPPFHLYCPAHLPTSSTMIFLTMQPADQLDGSRCFILWFQANSISCRQCALLFVIIEAFVSFGYFFFFIILFVCVFFSSSLHFLILVFRLQLFHIIIINITHVSSSSSHFHVTVPIYSHLISYPKHQITRPTNAQINKSVPFLSYINYVGNLYRLPIVAFTRHSNKQTHTHTRTHRHMNSKS